MAKIDKVKLKKDIHRKFGSLVNFSKITDTKYSDLLRILNTSEFTGEEITDVHRKYIEFDIDEGIEGFIDDSDRESVRICVAVHFKSTTAFCEEHPEYDEVYISNVVTGRLKRVTTKYGGLIDLLKRKYNYDKFALQV